MKVIFCIFHVLAYYVIINYELLLLIASSNSTSTTTTRTTASNQQLFIRGMYTTHRSTRPKRLYTTIPIKLQHPATESRANQWLWHSNSNTSPSV